MITKIIILALLLILVLITGIWMSRLGKPYQTVLFNVHKFATLALIVLGILILRNTSSDEGLSSIQWVLAIGTGLFLLISMISGGTLSAKKETATFINLSHKIASVLTLVGLILLFVFLF